MPTWDLSPDCIIRIAAISSGVRHAGTPECTRLKDEAGTALNLRALDWFALKHPISQHACDSRGLRWSPLLLLLLSGPPRFGSASGENIIDVDI